MSGSYNIDLNAATEHGIIVVNAPDGNTIAAAEHALALMLALARNIPQADPAQPETGPLGPQAFSEGLELRQKTLGYHGPGADRVCCCPPGSGL